jgi:hypothetical protein
MIKKLPIIGFAVASVTLGLSIVAFLAFVKAIEEKYDKDYFWE